MQLGGWSSIFAIIRDDRLTWWRIVHSNSIRNTNVWPQLNAVFRFYAEVISLPIGQIQSGCCNWGICPFRCPRNNICSACCCSYGILIFWNTRFLVSWCPWSVQLGCWCSISTIIRNGRLTWRRVVHSNSIRNANRWPQTSVVFRFYAEVINLPIGQIQVCCCNGSVSACWCPGNDIGSTIGCANGILVFCNAWLGIVRYPRSVQLTAWNGIIPTIGDDGSGWWTSVDFYFNSFFIFQIPCVILRTVVNGRTWNGEWVRVCLPGVRIYLVSYLFDTWRTIRRLKRHGYIGSPPIIFPLSAWQSHAGFGRCAVYREIVIADIFR